MSIRFDSGSDQATRTSNLLDYTSDYTIMGWGYMVVDTNTQTVIFALTSGSVNSFDIIGHDSNGTQIRLGGRSGNGVPTFGNNATNVTTGTWHHYAMRRSGTSLQFVLDGVQEFTITHGTGSRLTAGETVIGGQVASTGAPFNGRVFGVREYSSALSDAQIVTEMDSETAVRTSDLVNDVPFSTNATALTGTNFTEEGTITYEADPPFAGGGSIIPLIMHHRAQMI